MGVKFLKEVSELAGSPEHSNVLAVIVAFNHRQRTAFPWDIVVKAMSELAYIESSVAISKKHDYIEGKLQDVREDLDRLGLILVDSTGLFPSKEALRISKEDDVLRSKVIEADDSLRQLRF